ncbi:MAG: hypothetical protein GY822_14655 [Deltaproteobacteria bacterium]|nr:hypothetical protein [Deltaproteobacteria bacterium]
MTIVHRVIPVVLLDADGELKEPFSRGGMEIPYVESVCGFHARDGADEVWLRLFEPGKKGVRSLFDPLKTIRPMVRVPLVVGGGIQSVSDARLLIELGADRVIIDVGQVFEETTTEASAESLEKILDFTSSVADAIGADAFTVSMSIRRLTANPKVTWEIINAKGENTGFDAVHFAVELANRGAGELVLGVEEEKGIVHDAEIVERLAELLHIQLVSLGEKRSLDEIAAPLLIGADAIASHGLFADGSYTVAAVKEKLRDFGAVTRPCIPPYSS